MTTANTIKIVAGKFYALDPFATGSPVVSGPYDSAAEARKDANQMNIGEDLEIGEAYVFARPDGKRVFKMRPAK